MIGACGERSRFVAGGLSDTMYGLSSLVCFDDAVDAFYGGSLAVVSTDVLQCADW